MFGGGPASGPPGGPSPAEDGPEDGFPAWPKGYDTLTLGELPWAPWPGGKVTVRAIAFDPCTIADVRMSSLTHCARFGGFKAQRHWAKRFLSPHKLAVWLASCVPEVKPTPAEVFRRQWRAAVEAVMAPLLEGVKLAQHDWWARAARG